MIVFTNFNVGVLNDKTLIRDLAHVILAHDHFARDAAARLFHFEGGLYQENGELYVKRQVKQLTVRFGNAGRWNRTLAQEVIEYIALDVPDCSIALRWTRSIWSTGSWMCGAANSSRTRNHFPVRFASLFRTIPLLPARE